MEQKICTDEGKLIRVNRNIQAEGVFAMTKEDMGFRRFMLRSSVKVEVECMLLSLAYNLLKLHHKTRKQIEEFLENRNIKTVYMRDETIIDIGGIIPITMKEQVN